MRDNDWSEMIQDCFEVIFQFSSIQDRVSMESVCRTWRNMILNDNNLWMRMRTLDLSSSLWGFTKRKIPKAILLGLLQHKCGSHLRRINLSDLQDNRLDESMNTTEEHYNMASAIMRYCPNLEDIDFTLLLLGSRNLDQIAETYRNIIKLKFGPINPYCDHTLRDIFEANQNLRYLKINSYRFNECLSFLPLQMHTIILQECIFEAPEIIEEVLRRLENLRHLTLYKCVNLLDNILLVVSKHCRNLTKFEFVCRSRSNHIVDNLINLTDLETLTIHNNCNVTDAFLARLELHCRHLSYIDISNCYNVTNVGLAAIARLQRLETLILNYMDQITFYCLPIMHHLKKLNCQEYLKDPLMEECIDVNMLCLSEYAPHLQLLDLSSCEYMTDEGLKAIARLQRLETLILNGTVRISCNDLPIMHHLKELYLQRCSRIRNKSLLMISKSAPHLQLLDISSCNNVNNKGLAVTAKLVQLEKLILNNLQLITGKYLQNVSHLKELHCQSCRLINDESMSRFIENSPQLQLLNIFGCHNITNRTLQAAINFYKNRFNNVTMIVGETQISIKTEIPKNLKLISGRMNFNGYVVY